MYKRILGLDLGDKWIGVAHTDLTQTIVFPYGTWKLENFETELKMYMSQHPLECVVIGLPITMQGNHSEQTEKVIKLVEDIRKKFTEITFHLRDERLSTQFAKKIVRANNNKKSTDHAIAASIILENFLTQLNSI